MNTDNLWKQFVTDGTIDSYLRYKKEEKLKEKANNDNKSVYNRGTGYKGTTNRREG